VSCQRLVADFETGQEMARGTLKNLKRARPSSTRQTVGRDIGGQDPASLAQAGADLYGADLVGWLNCECLFSLILVGLLAALPFNLHCNGADESYAMRPVSILTNNGALV
jgi:hypothetical protein